MIHNAWAEMGANAKLFYDAFRGLCRMRIAYAEQMISEARADCDAYWTEEKSEQLDKTDKFWTHVQDYWQKKLEHSYELEKEYFAPEKPLEVITKEGIKVSTDMPCGIKEVYDILQ